LFHLRVLLRAILIGLSLLFAAFSFRGNLMVRRRGLHLRRLRHRFLLFRELLRVR
jgi:hypothetical protein